MSFGGYNRYFVLDMYPGMQCASWGSIRLALVDIAKRFSKVVVPVCSTIGSAGAFPSLGMVHPFINNWSHPAGVAMVAHILNLHFPEDG